MTTALFGKPEAYGVELTPHAKPAKREVHVTGYVVVEIAVDEWIEVDSDLDDDEIKKEVLEDLDCGEGEIERASLTIEGEPSKRVELRKQRERERELLEAWNSGAPIRC